MAADAETITHFSAITQQEHGCVVSDCNVLCIIKQCHVQPQIYKHGFSQVSWKMNEYFYWTGNSSLRNAYSHIHCRDKSTSG